MTSITPQALNMPLRIWLQVTERFLAEGEDLDYSDEVTWCRDKINDDDVEYVRADQLPPLCPLHRNLDDKGNLELEIGNDCVACSLNERTDLLSVLAGNAPVDGRTDSVTVLRGLQSEITALRSQVAELQAERDRLKVENRRIASDAFKKIDEAFQRETEEIDVISARIAARDVESFRSQLVAEVRNRGRETALTSAWNGSDLEFDQAVASSSPIVDEIAKLIENYSPDSPKGETG